MSEETPPRAAWTQSPADLRAVRDVVERWLEPDPEHGLTLELFDADPLAWATAAEDWGLTVTSTWPSVQAAQDRAERCRAAFVEAGWTDQWSAGVCARPAPVSGQWQGEVQPDFGLLPPQEGGNSAGYTLRDGRPWWRRRGARRRG